MIAEFNRDWLDHFQAEKCGLYMLIDGAVKDEPRRLFYELEGDPDYIPLFLGGRYEEHLEVGPFLVSLKNQNIFRWFLGEDKPTYAGILLATRLGPRELSRELNRNFTVIMPDGTYSFLRYFDPYVLGDLCDMLSTNDLHTLCRPMAGFAYNTMLDGNINAWRYFYGHNKPDEVYGEPRHLTVTPEYLQCFEDGAERRILCGHIENIRTLKNIPQAACGKETTMEEYKGFSVVTEHARHAHPIDAPELEAVYARLAELEAAYDVCDFDTLLELDVILQLADASNRETILAILASSRLQVCERVALCRKHLQPQPVS